MKKVIDIKSLIIGVLVTALAFTIIGARGKNSANFDTITAKTIRIVNQKGEVAAILTSSSSATILSLYSGEGKPRVMLGCTNIGGALVINNQHDKMVAGLASTDAGGGQLLINNQHGKIVATLQSHGAGGGALVINNQHDKAVVTLESSYAGSGGLWINNQHGKEVVRLESNKNGDGMIVLFDRYGDPGWAKIGKR